MSRESLVFLFGIVVFVTPFLGVTGDIKRYITVASGIVLIIAGYQLRRAAYFRSIEEVSGEHRSETFAESKTAKKETDGLEPVPEQEEVDI